MTGAPASVHQAALDQIRRALAEAQASTAGFGAVAAPTVAARCRPLEAGASLYGTVMA